MQTTDSNTTAAILASLERQWPNRISLTRKETAKTLGFKNAITIDRARIRGLIRASIATRRPTYSLPAIAEFLASTR